MHILLGFVNEDKFQQCGKDCPMREAYRYSKLKKIREEHIEKHYGVVKPGTEKPVFMRRKNNISRLSKARTLKSKEVMFEAMLSLTKQL